jgi:hypothetical protein
VSVAVADVSDRLVQAARAASLPSPIFEAMKDQRGPYFAELEASSRPRTCWAGASPEDPTEWWYFEAVEDAGEVVAIGQVTIDRAGGRHAYSADHLEDDWGFLTDQALAPEGFEGLGPCSAQRFHAAWDVLVPIGSTLGCIRGGMGLSAVMEAALITIARSEAAVPERRFSFRVGGTWHCPADGQRLAEIDGVISCEACDRCLPVNVVYQIVEGHVHER